MPVEKAEKILGIYSYGHSVDHVCGVDPTVHHAWKLRRGRSDLQRVRCIARICRLEIDNCKIFV